MKRLWVLVFLFLLLWLSSMLFYWPLPLVVVLFAALVSLSTMTIGQALEERHARRT